MKVLLSILMVVTARTLALAADDAPVTEVRRSDRHVELSIRSDGHPVAGPYQVDVYLPPDYAAGREACRVLYVFDGSDLSREHDALWREGLIHPAIFVSIQNKNPQSRFYDLTPPPIGSIRPGAGGLETLGKLITDRLKPYIDAHFHTLPGPTYTGVVGNSLGGLAACWLGYLHPQTFGLAACLEPSLWWDDKQLLKRLQQDSSAKTRTRFWIMAAEQEYPGMWRDAKRAAFALAKRGWREGEDVAFFQVHNGSHGWDSCQTQLRDMLHFLLRKAPPRLIDIELTNCHGPQHDAIRLREAGEFANAYLDLNDPLDQDGLEIMLDARPDPMRSLGRGKERYFDFLTFQLAPGETAGAMKLRRSKDGESVLPEGLRAACVRAPGGYTAELAIPAAALDRAQGGLWKEFRLNICQVNVDATNGPIRHITWQPAWESTQNVIASGTFSRAATTSVR